MSLKLIEIKKSTRPNKRLMAIFSKDDKKITRHFGFRTSETGKTGSTFIDHKDPKKKNAYIARHKVNEEEFWRTKPEAPATLSRFILWNKPTLQASIKDYKKRFKI